MGATITDAGINTILAALTDKTGDNPFLRINDKTYVRFNSVTLEAVPGRGNEFTVFFCWNGERLLKMPTRSIRFDSGDVLTIEGVEGRMEFHLEGN